VPDGAAAGSHEVVASNDFCELTATITVSDSGAALPRTGSQNTAQMVIIALAAVVFGTSLAMVARRRRRSLAGNA
jgi:LPXTG-motif cell wall-anchored protein